MKTLVLVRHAKSSWKDVTLSDHNRPLSKRGKKDAPFMAGILKDLKINPHYVLSSTAVRAADTAKIFCEKLGVSPDKINYDEDLYEATSREILQVVGAVSEKHTTILIFGHNPGITNLVNNLSGKLIDNIPTAGITVLSFEGSWKDLGQSRCEIKNFEYPRKYYPKEEV